MENYNNMRSANKAAFILDSISTHKGKMAGIPSISTSALVNPYCIARRKNNCSVCSHCYACKYLTLRLGLREKTERNTEFYTTVRLSDNDIPFINSAVFRFESFGEIANATQLENYFNIAWNNEHCHFALWSKNHDLIIDYCRKHCRPENLNIIFSSLYINESDYNELLEKYGDDFIETCDAVFTVYTKEFSSKHNIPINCGSRKCAACGLCYSRLSEVGEPIEINEILK